LSLGRTSRILGILNVTPDSFSDGGTHLDPEQAVEAAARMAEEGADLVDVGGESTRPGAEPVDAAEEARRVVPVVERIKRRTGIRVSVDTTKASVARRALDAGADLVNDVSALSDPAMVGVLAETHAPAIVMHRRGTPRTMQDDTRYDDLLDEIRDHLGGVLRKAQEGGIRDDKILVDPGVGFGKSAEGNLEILRRLSELRSLGRPIVIGASRKAFIGAVLTLPVADRLEGSLAAAAIALWEGAHVIRVHDVAASARVARMVDALRSA
jgi:dihydropteroate synthase